MFLLRTCQKQKLSLMIFCYDQNNVIDCVPITPGQNWEKFGFFFNPGKWQIACQLQPFKYQYKLVNNKSSV